MTRLWLAPFSATQPGSNVQVSRPWQPKADGGSPANFIIDLWHGQFNGDQKSVRRIYVGRAMKRFKEARQILWGYADPLVGDAQRHLPISILQGDLYGFPRRRVLERIVDEVAERLLQEPCVKDRTHGPRPLNCVLAECSCDTRVLCRQ